jgi:hypothetical protein
MMFACFVRGGARLARLGPIIAKIRFVMGPVYLDDAPISGQQKTICAV